MSVYIIADLEETVKELRTPKTTSKQKNNDLLRTNYELFKKVLYSVIN